MPWFPEFVRRNLSWLAGLHASTETVASTVAGRRAVVELLAHVNHGARELAWPVAVVAESPDDRSMVFRTYCNQWPVDQRRHVRPAFLKAGAAHPGDVVGRYQAALDAGDTEAVVRTFAPDGYFRGPSGPRHTHRGAAELRSFFAGCFSAGGGIGLEHCAVTDDGVGDNGGRSYRLHGPWRYKVSEGNQPAYEIALTHFIVSDDVERSRRFYTEVLGGTTVRSGEPTYVALANSWIIINVGGGPTGDKPTVTLDTPRDPDLSSSFLNIRVSDIHAVYAEWNARGAEFLTPPKQHDTEIRCYLRDPDGHLIEVGQTTLPGGWRQFLDP